MADKKITVREHTRTVSGKKRDKTKGIIGSTPVTPGAVNQGIHDRNKPLKGVTIVGGGTAANSGLVEPKGVDIVSRPR
jgi:hypothetical protein